MTDARIISKPKYTLLRLPGQVVIKRDGLFLSRHTDDVMYKYGSIPQSEFEDLERQATYKKDVYGVFGQIELANIHHLIVIEECILEGQILRSDVFRVR